MSDDLSLLQGTLDVLILKALSWGPRHGYAIARWIRETTDAALSIEDGALYTALHRMEKREWLTSEWGLTDAGRRVKLYSVTPAGQRALRSQTEQWSRYAAAVGKILLATGA